MLSITCPHCQADLPAAARFCPSCGRPVGPVTLVEPPFSAPLPHLAAERRPVTVMFADISGFTTMSEQMDPEETRRLINDCFDELVPVIERYGGVVDKFIGDEVMALFGAPVSHEDDPARALYAALGMLQALARFNARHGTHLDIHIGVNSGRVVAGNIGSRGRQVYSVMGAAVNLAARLREAAGPGAVFVGPETQRATAPLFRFAALEPVLTKGRAEPVPVYHLLELRAQPGQTRGLAGLVSPLVGRDTELAALLRLSEAVRERQGRVALVVGEAGLGKSRLIAEWRAAVAPTMRWVEGHATSYGQRQAYQILIDLLRALIGVTATTGEAETRAALRQLAEGLFGAGAPTVTPYLASLLALPLEGEWLERVRQLDPQTLQNQVLSSLRRLLKALAARGPLVLILEDVHWADPSSTDLLIRLLPLAGEAAILFCFTTRPDREAPGWRLVTAAREGMDGRLTEIELQALSEAVGRQLIGNLLQVEALPEPVRALILSRAEGNPFFLEEVIRTLIERGAIVKEDDHWAARGPVELAEIPDNLQGLLLGRIDRLPADARHTLLVASVIGRRIPIRVLAEVLETVEPAALQGQLDRLEMADLLRRTSVEAEPEVSFRHALVHETAYEALLLEDRRRLHRTVAQTLERLFADRLEGLAATLARHFLAAEDCQQGLKYLTLAGDAAYRQYALTEAVAHYTSALELARCADAEPTADLPHLYTCRGRALELDGRDEEAIGNYEEMAALARTLGDPAMELTAVTEQAKVHCTPNRTLDLARGQTLAERALEMSRNLVDRAAESRVEWTLMLLALRRGQSAQAVAHGERSLALAREANLREQVAYTLQDLQRAYLWDGQLERARAALDEVRSMWRELGNLPMLTDALSSTADMLVGEGKYEQALERAGEALRLSESIGNLWNQAYAQGMIGEACLALGRVDKALDAMQTAIELSRQSGPVILETRVRFQLVRAYILLGAPVQAREALDAVAQMPPTAFRRIRSSLILVALEARTGSPDAAAIALQEAERMLEPRTDLPPTIAIIRAEVALVQNDVGRFDAVLEPLDDCIARVRRGAEPFESLLRALSLKGMLLLRMGELEKAEAPLREALTQAQATRSRFVLLDVLLGLIELETRRGNADEAARLRQQAGDVTAIIAGHITSPDLRTSFLNRLR